MDKREIENMKRYQAASLKRLRASFTEEETALYNEYAGMIKREKHTLQADDVLKMQYDPRWTEEAGTAIIIMSFLENFDEYAGMLRKTPAWYPPEKIN